MTHAMLLSLGLLLCSAPKPGGLAFCTDGVRSLLASLPATPHLHPASRHGLPSPPSSEETSFSDPEDKEEESDPSFMGGTTCPGDRLSATEHPDQMGGSPAVRQGFLNRLHRSRQLQC